MITMPITEYTMRSTGISFPVLVVVIGIVLTESMMGYGSEFEASPSNEYSKSTMPLVSSSGDI